MPRFARAVAVDHPHHVVHRGNRRQAIFHSDTHRLRYLEMLRHNCARHRAEIWAWCLMPNHVHAIVVPRDPDSLARAIGRTHGSWALALNREARLSGHLWENRYYSCPLDETHLWAAVRYVERNPVRAGLVASCVDFLWSSARAHGLGTADRLLSPSGPFALGAAGWTAWLDAPIEEPEVEEIRRRTRTGRPAGRPAFVRQMEQELGRSLEAGRRGPRPREAAATLLHALGN